MKAVEALPGAVVVQDGSFVGVAAPTHHEAEAALGAIHAEWDSPPQPSDKTLFEDLKKESRGGGRGFGGGGNREVGSIEKGLEQAVHKLKASYTIAYIAHAPLETRAAVAEWDNGNSRCGREHNGHSESAASWRVRSPFQKRRSG